MATAKNRQSSDRMNHGDIETPSDPNAMGPTMRPVSDATASGPNAGADMHNDHYPPPLPGRNNGFIGVHGQRYTDDRRSGPAGKWPR